MAPESFSLTKCSVPKAPRRICFRTQTGEGDPTIFTDTSRLKLTSDSDISKQSQ